MKNLITHTNFIHELLIQSDLFTYPNDINDTNYWKTTKQYNELTYKKETVYIHKPTAYKQFLKAQQGMAQLVAKVVGSRHRVTNDFEFSYDTVRQLFGRNETFIAWNDIWGVFKKTTSHIASNIATTKDDAHACRYDFQLKFQVKFNALVHSLANDEVTVDLSRVKKAPTWTPDHYDLLTYVTPDVNSLRHAIRAPGYTVDQRLYFWAYVKVTEYHDGKIPQFYKLGDNSARYRGFGPLDLQNKPKAIREMILKPYNKYDMNAAAFAMLLSRVDSKNYPALTSYVNNTKQFRMSVLADVEVYGVELEHIKLAITAVGFGSNLSPYSRLAKKMSNNILSVLRINPLISAIRNEMAQLREELGLSKSQAGLLAQELESSVMKFIRNTTLEPQHCLVVHDEIYTMDVLDTTELSAEINNIFNINVQIKG